jgi:hypothetical protein
MQKSYMSIGTVLHKQPKQLLRFTYTLQHYAHTYISHVVCKGRQAVYISSI